MLQKNWHLCTLMAASACKICFRVAMSSLVAAHFPNQISMGRHLNIRKHAWRCGLANAKKYYYDERTALVHTSCLLVSCLVIEWPPVAWKLCKLYPHGRQLHANYSRFNSCCMRLPATQVQFACDWRPGGYNLYVTCGHNLYVTGHQTHANFACASGQLHAKPPVFLQACCENNYLNQKMKTLLKNLRIYVTQVFAEAYPLTLCMA